MASRYYEVNFRNSKTGVDIKNVKFCIWDYDLYDATHQVFSDLSKDDTRTLLMPEWVNYFVTTKGFFTYCNGRTFGFDPPLPTPETLSFELVRNSQYYVDGLFASGESGAQLYLDDGTFWDVKTSSPGLLAFFINDDFTEGKVICLGYGNFSSGKYPNMVLNDGNWWYFRLDNQNINLTSNELSGLKTFLSNLTPGDPHEPGNPYEPGGPSGPSDIPPGTFDDTSDPIPIPPIPTVSAADTGFTRIYNPTLSQVQNLARYLWTDASVIETIWNHIKQFFESPMEAIIGFNLVPCRVPDGGTKNFALMFIDTGVSMNTAATQFVDVDCGTVKLDRYYGSALDQSPYTKVSCFLPYIGMVQLNTDEVMGATLGVTYRIDIVSGSCVAMITVDGNVLYQYSGHCAITIPFSAADFSNYVSAAISVAKLAIGAAVGGGIGAIASAGIDPEQQTNIIKTTTTTETVTTNALTGSERRSFSTKVKEEPIDSAITSASFLGLTPRNISNTVGEVVTSKPHVEHSGSFSGNSGYLGVRRPYLIIERPRMCMPEQYQRFNGFPAMYTQTLSSCSGFTQVQQVQLTGMTATNPEQSEILQLLKSGVIL